jgi:hypothetical protein
MDGIDMAQEDCNCDYGCIGQSCICIYDYETGICYVACGPPITVEADEVVPLDRTVNIDTRNTDLASLAEFINAVSEADLLIRVADIRKPITMRMKGVPLREVVDSAGLADAGHSRSAG